MTLPLVLDLLLGSDLRRVAALPLSLRGQHNLMSNANCNTYAVGSTRRETGVAFSADLLVALGSAVVSGRVRCTARGGHLGRRGDTHVVLVGKDLERGLNDTTSESEDKVEGGLLLDVYRSAVDRNDRYPIDRSRCSVHDVPPSPSCCFLHVPAPWYRQPCSSAWLIPTPTTPLNVHDPIPLRPRCLPLAPSCRAHCIQDRQIGRRGLTVVRKGSSVLELLSGEDQSLLVRRDTLLVLDLRLDIVDGVGGLDLEGDGLAREAIKSARMFTSPFNPPALTS
jgi:hypothetical protein